VVNAIINAHGGLAVPDAEYEFVTEPIGLLGSGE
jgi:hypothetical protein